MIIRSPPRNAAAFELKVPLPVSLHLRLHILKVREGKLIGAVVTEALEAYFTRQAGAEAGDRAATPLPGRKEDAHRHPSTQGWPGPIPTSTSAASSE